MPNCSLCNGPMSTGTYSPDGYPHSVEDCIKYLGSRVQELEGRTRGDIVFGPKPTYKILDDTSLLSDVDIRWIKEVNTIMRACPNCGSESKPINCGTFYRCSVCPYETKVLKKK